MKKINLLIGLLALYVFPAAAFAMDAPSVDAVPESIDADTYTLVIHTEPGAKVTVVGGPIQLAPLTDGLGTDVEDGVVDFMVALAQNQTNTFSVIAEKDGETSDSVTVTIVESSESEKGGSQADTTPPEPPVLNKIPDFVDTAEYLITGTAEANANIYVRKRDGTVAGSTQAAANGFFQAKVPLEEGKTNRFNVSAEDEAGNEGGATQAVIRQTVDLPDPEPEEEGIPKVTSAQIFFDDTEGHWAKEYINRLYEEEIVSGKSERTFDPNGKITRAELTKIAILAFGHSVNTSVKEHPFSDVPMNSWFAPYVEEAKRLGFISGYPEGGFHPNEPITRAAALKILIEAAGHSVSGGTTSFSDVPSGAWFAPYVSFANAAGIVGGYPDGTFRPGNNITRAEVAKIVVMILEMKE